MSKPSQPNLQETLDQLPATVKNLSKQLEEAQAQLERKQTDLRSLEAKIEVKEKVVSDLEAAIADSRRELESLEKRNKQVVDAAELKLKELYVKAEKALKVYKNTQASVEATQSEMAERILAIDKREEVVARKEHALKDAEAQVAELHRYMKL